MKTTIENILMVSFKNSARALWSDYKHYYLSNTYFKTEQKNTYLSANIL